MQAIKLQSASVQVLQLQNALIRRHQVERLTAISRSGIYSRLDPKSLNYDPSFPKPIALSATSVAWIESEIQEWILKRIKVSREPGAAETRRQEIMRRRKSCPINSILEGQ